MRRYEKSTVQIPPPSDLHAAIAALGGDVYWGDDGKLVVRVPDECDESARAAVARCEAAIL